MRRVLEFPAQEWRTVPAPLDDKPGDEYVFIILGDDAFSANLCKGAAVVVRLGDELDTGLQAIDIPGARDLIRHVKKHEDGSVTVSCSRYPPKVYKAGEYKIVGAVVQLRGAPGGRWEWIPDDYEAEYERPLYVVKKKTSDS